MAAVPHRYREFSLVPGRHDPGRGLEGKPGRAGAGMGQCPGDEQRHLGARDRFVGREPRTRRAGRHAHLKQRSDDLVHTTRNIPEILEVLILFGFHIVDVDTPRSDRGRFEEPGQELGHLPARDHAVGRESRLRGPLGYLELRQLIDGIPDVTPQTADIPEALIGGTWDLDSCRPCRPDQEERHLPAGSPHLQDRSRPWKSRG